MEELRFFDDKPNAWSINPCARPSWMGRGGRIRDESGNALSGFVVKTTKKTRKVSVVDNGYYQRHYRFPMSPVAPASPFVRWENVPMCGIPVIGPDGASISNKEAIIDAVFAGKKPVGDIMYVEDTLSDRELLVKKAQAQGFEVAMRDHEHINNRVYFVMFGVARTLAELFDLDAIAQYYSTACKVDQESLARCLHRFSGLTPVATLQTYNWSSPEEFVELILTGLCLGYAFESTLAILLESSD